MHSWKNQEPADLNLFNATELRYKNITLSMLPGAMSGKNQPSLWQKNWSLIRLTANLINPTSTDFWWTDFSLSCRKITIIKNRTNKKLVQAIIFFRQENDWLCVSTKWKQIRFEIFVATLLLFLSDSSDLRKTKSCFTMTFQNEGLYQWPCWIPQFPSEHRS